MATIYSSVAVWMAMDGAMQPGDVHTWSDVWDARFLNGNGGNVVPYALAIPETQYHMRLATTNQFMEANPDGWVFVFNVTNVGTNPIREYLVRFSYVVNN
jgi:hypothetical protein